jgi:hypothetical protein
MAESLKLSGRLVEFGKELHTKKPAGGDEVNSTHSLIWALSDGGLTDMCRGSRRLVTRAETYLSLYILAG